MDMIYGFIGALCFLLVYWIIHGFIQFVDTSKRLRNRKYHETSCSTCARDIYSKICKKCYNGSHYKKM